MAIDQVIRIVVDTTYSGAVRCQSVFNFATEQIGPGIDAADIANDFATNFVLSTWRANIGSVLSFNNLFAQSLYPDGSQGVTVGLGGVGGTKAAVFSANEIMPVVCAGITTWRTAFAGRRNRGRTYWTALVAGNSFDGVNLSSGRRTDLTTIANALKARYITGAGLHNGWKLMLRSTSRTGVNPPIDLTGMIPIQDYSIPNYIATMGSRRGGRGI